ncbi:hypothetical protein SALBM311S_02794 [Streptomyces alboniger]
MRRIVVVGASAAGLAAAETLRREGYDGALTLVGDEPLPRTTGRHCPSNSWPRSGRRSGWRCAPPPT